MEYHYVFYLGRTLWYLKRECALLSYMSYPDTVILAYKEVIYDSMQYYRLHKKNCEKWLKI